MRKDPDDWQVFTERLYDQSKFAIKLGLDNIKAALDREGNPQNSHPNIIIGGTNGKGQSAAFLSNILEAHGYRVGLFTSPHLIEFRERFRINGVPVTRREVLEKGKYVLERYSHGEIVLTFFEMCVLIGVLIFKDKEIDIAIMEVGIGGRLDAVNAISRVVSVVTNVGFDHEAYLGETLEEIAAEKFAIFQDGIPGVLGPQTYQELYTYLPDEIHHAPTADSFVEKNANTAMLAASLFLGRSFRKEKCKYAITNTRWPGRAQRITLFGDYEVWVDAAHNPLGLNALFHEIDLDTFDVIIFGAMKDKNLAQMGEVLESFKKSIWGVSIQSRRAANQEMLEKNMKLERFGTLDVLLKDRPRVLICGSIYLLGEVLVYGGLDVENLDIKKK